MPFGFFFDPTMILVIPGIILTLWAQAKVQSWTGRLKGHIEDVNKRRAEAGEPATKRMRYRETPMSGKPKG